MNSALRNCKDCLREGCGTHRPAPEPGPRCVTHWRAEKARRRQLRHGTHIGKTYGLTPEDYQAIYVAQDGCCFICRKAKGISKMLAVDHDHACTAGHPPEQGCRECVRCLACTTCNRVVLGRYDAPALRRAIEVLEDPPAQRVLHGYHLGNGKA